MSVIDSLVAQLKKADSLIPSYWIAPFTKLLYSQLTSDKISHDTLANLLKTFSSDEGITISYDRLQTFFYMFGPVSRMPEKICEFMKYGCYKYWWGDTINKELAVRILSIAPNGTFLVRLGTTCLPTITYKYNDGLIHHYRIKYVLGKFCIGHGGFSTEYDNLWQLISHRHDMFRLPCGPYANCLF